MSLWQERDGAAGVAVVGKTVGVFVRGARSELLSRRWTMSVFTIIDGLVFTVFDRLRIRYREEMLGCRAAVGASSRYAAPPLCYGPPGDPPPGRITQLLAQPARMGRVAGGTRPRLPASPRPANRRGGKGTP